jgi:V-type H+-transporting ATPase subunit B
MNFTVITRAMQHYTTEFEGQFEKTFLSQDPYDNRDIFTSLNMCWDLLETFPEEELKQITPSIKNLFYTREARRMFGKCR